MSSTLDSGEVVNERPQKTPLRELITGVPRRLWRFYVLFRELLPSGACQRGGDGHGDLPARIVPLDHLLRWSAPHALGNHKY